MTQLMMPTNQQIINEAIRQIHADGYEKISLRQLAKQVGLTTGAFYKHFNSKAALFKEVTVILSGDLATEVTPRLDLSASPQSQLLQMADWLMQKFQTDAHTMDFLFFNPVAQRLLSHPAASDQFSFYQLTTGLIDQLKPQYPKLDSQRLFIQIWAFIQGYGLLIIKRVVPYEPDLLSSTLTALLKA
ncbi:TetR/AcrR family transcriptional regulator [Lactiplantibacillus sp. WILCCON 0030]|uniref:TetR/AcrR family transcriptional regulator n=1 Tax=Lactiplantibacillus brownii TaxID=3069269 RepID=A0ABU1ABQ1_9LACO|nr:TetR/AcrR family transcriptional regulator [Lactiplantibacillus brownii]MDQ7938391.1 TetR/AcrR family transcriptional regulator [Lactiplantibacillus brownii]